MSILKDLQRALRTVGPPCKRGGETDLSFQAR